MMENIRNLQMKLAAIDEFLDVLPKIMLEDGV